MVACRGRAPLSRIEEGREGCFEVLQKVLSLWSVPDHWVALRYCSNHPASSGCSRVKSNSSKDVKLHWMRPTPLLRLFAGYRHRAVSIIFFFYFHRNYEEGSSRIPASHCAALQRMADRWPRQQNSGIVPLNPETAWEGTTKVEMRLIGFDSGYGFFSKSSLYYFLFIYSLFLFIWLRHRL